MRPSAEKVFSSVVAVSAAVIAITFAKREFFPSQLRSVTTSSAATSQPRLVLDWENALSVGAASTPDTAEVTLVEFADLECPFCRAFHQELLPKLQQEFGSRLKFVFVHFPIPSHKFAKPAARVAECAKTRGVFWQMVDDIYSAQDSLGLKAWGSFASDAGPIDSAYYEDCARSEGTVRAIDDGFSFGQRAGVRGTPALMLNGWLFDQPPSHEALRTAIAAMLEGKMPFHSAN